jgi:flagellar biosynthesis chaperone FliJ
MVIEKISQRMHDHVVEWALQHYRQHIGALMDSASAEKDARNYRIFIAVLDTAIAKHNKRMARPRIPNATDDALTEQFARML